MPQTEVLTPKKLRERLEAKRAAQTRGHYRIGVGSNGPASRRVHMSGDEQGYVTLSRLEADDAPQSIVAEIQDSQARQLKRQGFEVEEAEATKTESKKPELPKSDKAKAKEAMEADAAKADAKKKGAE